ncbi:hypothetical protein ANO11243_089260 [Dothideomycetidae sp. 11243]|nr:hypothetical protein ANO11243_089260 [fungal sp. No.11243]
MASTILRSILEARLQNAQDTLTKLARSIERLPPELRFMIYRECLKDHSPLECLHSIVPEWLTTPPHDYVATFVHISPPSVLWLSSSISREVLQRFSRQLSIYMEAINIRGTLDIRDHIPDSLSWLDSGLGEMTCLQLQFSGRDTMIIHCSQQVTGAGNCHIVVEVIHVVKRPKRGQNPRKYETLTWSGQNLFRGPYERKIVTKKFQRALGSRLQQSILEREGYGLTKPELEIIMDGLCLVAYGYQDTKGPWQGIRRNIKQQPYETQEEWDLDTASMLADDQERKQAEKERMRQIRRKLKLEEMWAAIAAHSQASG